MSSIEPRHGDAVFESSLPYEQPRIHAAAVYCSDGRFGEMMDEFLQRHLALPRYDRLAVPGGAACLAGHFTTYREEEGSGEQLQFLVDVHELERVILIAHQGCAFYSQRLRIASIDLYARQVEDLRKAIRRVSEMRDGISVEAYFAWVRESRVHFEQVSP